LELALTRPNLLQTQKEIKMSTQKATMQRYVEALNNRSMTPEDYVEIFAPDYVEITSQPIPPGPEGQQQL
jgi:hypothetical protein